MTLAVVTIHKGKYTNLERTINSIDEQKKKIKHIIVAKNLKLRQLKSLKKKFRVVVHNKDTSIYNAMNIGLKLSKNCHTLFLNSGDCFTDKNVTNCILSFAKKEKKCLIFKTQIIYKNKNYIPKNSFFFSKNYSPHPSFVRPPVKRGEIYKFEENLKIISDSIWIKKNLRKYGFKKIDKIITKHYIGGISSTPSLGLVYDNLKVSFFGLIKESIKLILYYILKDEHFYKFILKKNFDKL